MKNGRPGMAISDAVRGEYEAGNMEPDIRDDLGGMDSVRKMVILGRSGGLEVEKVGGAFVEGFVPPHFLDSPNPEHVINRLKGLDWLMSEEVARMDRENLVPRPVVKLQMDGQNRPTITLGLEWVKRESKFGVLEGTQNRLLILGTKNESETHLHDSYPKTGAGLWWTARNIRIDLMHLIRPDRKVAYRE